MIELRSIHKQFGTVKALQGVNLRVQPGSIHGIIGENGAGKSTLMKILTGFISRTSGTITFDGRAVSLKTPEEARSLGIGMLYQEPLDFPQLSVLDNFMAAAADGNPARQQQVLTRLCEKFGFKLKPGARQEKLTVGERQQVELMRLIRDECKVLILDEPTTGISQEQQELLFEALKKLRGEGTAIILVSHKLAEIHSLCDRVTVLRQGKQAGEQERPFDEKGLLQAMFDTLPTKSSRPAQKKIGRPILKMDTVSTTAGRVGLHQVNVTINEGEMVGLAGLDGSGQSVFLQIAYGLLEPEQGRVTTPVSEQDMVMRVFLPADRLREGLIAGLTIREHHLLAGKSPFILTARSGRAAAEQAIKTYSIHGTPTTTAEGLSGGNQQRLLLSLIPEEARLILLEHPTRGLDVQSGQWTWRHLRSHLPDNGAIVFASPDIEDIMEQASRVLVFFNGRILLDRPTDQTSYREVSLAITGRV
jgi:simple sugar transport system ATP-binding protein